MPRYHIFEKTRNYDYKYKGTGSGSNPNEALNRKMDNGGRSATIKRNGLYVCIPDNQFTTRWQVNPTTKGTGKNKITTWKKPK
tara:strand:- start:316 stop:564 length:249 start_codon:yes stop_codon:yes gene_type:complete